MPNECKNMKAVVNGYKFTDLEANSEGFILKGQKHSWNVKRLPDGRFHMIINGQNRIAEILEADHSKKSFRIKFDSGIYEIHLLDQFDDLLQQLGMTALNNTVLKSMKAPMPGMIMKISVKDGDPVEKGDPILILKAMKMENIIKSPGKAVIRKVLISEGQAVEKNQDLILF